MDWIIPSIFCAVFATVYVLKRSSFIATETAREYLRQGALVIDVRSVGEFRSGHLPQAMNMPLGELSELLPRQVSDKNRVLLLHCLSGTRSGMARRELKSLGYTKVFNLGSFNRAKSILNSVK